MDIERGQNGGVTIFQLSGRLDTISAPGLEQALLEEIEAGHGVELDFSGVNYLSSAGLRVILQGEKAAKAKGVKMTLRGVSAVVMEIFDMTGFSDILNIAG